MFGEPCSRLSLVIDSSLVVEYTLAYIETGMGENFDEMWMTFVRGTGLGAKTRADCGVSRV